jgi:hypothetical protein
MMRAAPLAMSVLAACGSSVSVPGARFANAPPVEAVNDRRHVAEQPRPRDFQRYLHNFDALFHRRVTRALELRRAERARGINALDEVPNSTWFTNRVGVRDVPIEELRERPGSIGSPEAHRPWTVVSSKVGGLTLGFIIKDARGEKFLLKFDPRGYPEAETGTQVIVGKLLWLFGYNVTDDYVVYLRKDDLVLAPDAAIKDGKGNSWPLDRDELDRRLDTVEVNEDGSIRALASHWLPGKPLGGHSPEGVRADDPNDRIPHELRRDLRGAYALFSWLDHNDLHDANRLDMWVADPADPQRHYVKHYWIDFGIGLGFGASKNLEPRYGYEYHLDFGAITRSLLSLGVLERPWERRQATNDLRGVGYYETEAYDPGSWVAQSPAYVPIYVADRVDKFWASKIMMRITRAHIEAAIDAARLTDPRAKAWLADALIARQRKTAKYWFDRVNPVDAFSVEGGELCFTDLALVHDFAPAKGTRYSLTFYDVEARRFGRIRKVPPGAGGRTCSKLFESRDADRYTIVRIEARRPKFEGATYVHVARDPGSGSPRVIGVWRE